MPVKPSPKMPKAPKVVDIFDRDLVRHNRNRAAKDFAAHDFLFDWTIRHLGDRLQDIKRDFPLALQIGARSAGQSTQEMRDHGGVKDLVTMDIAEGFLRQNTGNYCIQAEEEFLPFADNSFDLVFSALSLQSVNDLPGALIQINRVLKPDGLFIGAMFGGETLYQLRQTMMQAEIALKGGASPRVAPFADKPQTGELLQRAGFALPVVDSEVITVTYDHAFKLMQDLRGMGEGNSLTDRSKTLPGKKLLMETARLYQEKFAEPDGRIVANFEIVFMIGWAPHTSQQQPLRPGSAKTRLADALQTDEIKTGVKPQE